LKHTDQPRSLIGSEIIGGGHDHDRSTGHAESPRPTSG
jgi:hypothetical protein